MGTNTDTHDWTTSVLNGIPSSNPSSQGSESYAKEEVMGDSKETVSTGYNRTDAHMNT